MGDHGVFLDGRILRRLAPLDVSGDALEPRPLPALGYLERDLVLDADGLGLAAPGVHPLLIAAAIGTGEDDRLTALRGLHLPLGHELPALPADALQQNAGGLVCGVLRHEPSLNRQLQHRLAQAAGQRGVELLAGVLELTVLLDQGHELVHPLDDAALLGERRNRKK